MQAAGEEGTRRAFDPYLGARSLHARLGAISAAGPSRAGHLPGPSWVRRDGNRGQPAQPSSGPPDHRGGRRHALVETDGPREVEVLGARERTFRVDGYHYALVHATGIPRATTTPYELLDGERVWPAQTPPIRRASCAPMASTSCSGSPGARAAALHVLPHSLPKDQHPDGREVDALRVLADHMCRDDTSLGRRLLLLGDQVYADEVPPRERRLTSARGGTCRCPGGRGRRLRGVHAGCIASRGPSRTSAGCLSTVPTAMIFDDHDVHDDWNTSRRGSTTCGTGWWDERIVGGFTSYWLYQHMGNLSPATSPRRCPFAQLREADDGGPTSRVRVPRRPRGGGHAWSYCRDFGRTRLIMIDSRAAACSTRRTSARCSTRTSGSGSTSTPPATSITC